MLRLIIGFLGSQISGPAKALYLGHSATEAQSAVDAAQGFEAVHIAEIAHTRKARRSPGLPPVSEGSPSAGAEDIIAANALLEESETERKRLVVLLEEAMKKLEGSVEIEAQLDALRAERDVLVSELSEKNAALDSAVANIAALEALVKSAAPAEGIAEPAEAKAEAKPAKSKKAEAQPSEEPAVKPAADGAPSI